jgi:hypothetical protein
MPPGHWMWSSQRTRPRTSSSGRNTNSTGLDESHALCWLLPPPSSMMNSIRPYGECITARTSVGETCTAHGQAEQSTPSTASRRGPVSGPAPPTRRTGHITQCARQLCAELIQKRGACLDVHVHSVVRLVQRRLWPVRRCSQGHGERQARDALLEAPGRCHLLRRGELAVWESATSDALCPLTSTLSLSRATGRMFRKKASKTPTACSLTRI